MEKVGRYYIEYEKACPPYELNDRWCVQQLVRKDINFWNVVATFQSKEDAIEYIERKK